MGGEAQLVEFRQALGHVFGPPHGFHGHQPDAGLVRGVDRLVQRTVLGIKGIESQHDDVQKPALGRRVQVIRQPSVVTGKADQFDLAGTFQLFGDFLIGVALGPVQGIFAVFFRADAMDVNASR